MLKVLIVEDSIEVQRRLVDMLSSAHKVQVVGCATTAMQALALARQWCPDVVVLDVSLRDGDRGYTVLRSLTHLCPNCEVVMLSNFTWSSMRDGFLKAGACAYFDKAFEFSKARDWILERAIGRNAN